MDAIDLTIALLLAHVLGDFVFQHERVIRGKYAGRFSAYLEHMAVHALLSVLTVALFTGLLTSLKLWLLLAILLISHALIDWAKTALNARTERSLTVFLLDQILHILLIVIGSTWVCGISLLDPGLDLLPLDHTLAMLLTGFAVAVFGVGWINGMLLQPLADRYAEEAGRDHSMAREGMSRAGMIIGWLERTLILTAVLLQSPVGVGFILAAKSIFRFENTKAGQQAAEYFLIGTLLSVAQAIAIGLLLIELIQ